MYFQDVWLDPEGLDDRAMRKFAADVNYIWIAYYAHLPKRLNLRRDRVFRFVVNACPKNWTPPDGRFSNNGEVVEIFRVFDFDKYWELPDTQARKNLALNFMQRGVEAICRRLDVDPRPFQEAYRAVKAGPPFYSYVATKMQYNQNRTLRAFLEVRYAPGIGEIWALFQDPKSRLTKRVLAWSGVPSYVEVDYLIGKTRWRDRSTFVIFPRQRGKALVVRAPSLSA